MVRQYHRLNGYELEQIPGDREIVGFPDGSAVKESACNAGDIADQDSLPGLGRSSGKGNGNPLLQYSCLKNPMDRGAWQALSTGSQRVRTDLVTKQQQQESDHLT